MLNERTTCLPLAELKREDVYIVVIFLTSSNSISPLFVVVVLYFWLFPISSKEG